MATGDKGQTSATSHQEPALNLTKEIAPRVQDSGGATNPVRHLEQWTPWQIIECLDGISTVTQQVSLGLAGVLNHSLDTPPKHLGIPLRQKAQCTGRHERGQPLQKLPSPKPSPGPVSKGKDHNRPKSWRHRLCPVWQGCIQECVPSSFAIRKSKSCSL